jgi:cell division protein ZapA (FtsZ GTPase activity inhibitor)
MKIVISITVLALLAITNLSFAAKEVPFTLEDRDRLIRVETKVDEGLKAVHQRIDSIENLLYVVIAGIFVLIGFVIWDRRSALAPAIRKNKELEERQDKFERVIKEVALKNSDIAEALKRVGL